jgi:hypothetical protein
MAFDGNTLLLTNEVVAGDDADNLRYDPAGKKMFVGYGQVALEILDVRTLRVSCGEGVIDTFEQHDADHHRELTRTPSASGARTSLWVQEWNQLLVAVPHRGSQAAAVRTYQAN